MVNERGGTAGRARLYDVMVAGKTGTAQAKREGQNDTIAWFVGFAPFEQPKYAVCVMVQGGAHGGSVAAPIAAKILDESLALDRGDYALQIAALPPASKPHPFRMIDSVEVESDVPQADATADAGPPRLHNRNPAQTPANVIRSRRSSSPAAPCRDHLHKKPPLPTRRNHRA